MYLCGLVGVVDGMQKRGKKTGPQPCGRSRQNGGSANSEGVLNQWSSLLVWVGFICIKEISSVVIMLKIRFDTILVDVLIVTVV
jgi:hypothetical protein